MAREARKHPILFKEMNAAERLVQERCIFTWGWMKQFVQPAVLEGIYSLATEVVRLRRKVRQLEKTKAKAETTQAKSDAEINATEPLDD